MNRHLNAISGRLSLRHPQRDSLAILDRVCDILPPKKDSDQIAGLAAIQSEFLTVTDFEREFPSLCFSLATGVGKTRLMGAFISYLYLAHGIKNFFVLAPNLTIYNKLIADFTPNMSLKASRNLRLIILRSLLAITTKNLLPPSPAYLSVRSTSSTSPKSTRKSEAVKVPASNASPNTSAKATSTTSPD
jgi:type III restriction enzyme